MTQAIAPRAAMPDGYTLHFFDATTSTNDEAKRLAAAGAGEGATVWALSQSAGRGRQGRRWHSPPGNLYISYLVRPRRPLEEAAQLSFVAALALHDTIDRLQPGTAARVTLKWPNDVLIDGRKVAGVLLESGAGADGEPWVVVGIGLNVAATPRGTDLPATALGLPAGRQDLAAIVAQLSHGWARELQLWRRAGFADVRARWLAASAYLGATVTATLAGRTVTGIFTGMDATGALLMTDVSRRELRIAAGEIGAGHNVAAADRGPTIRAAGGRSEPV